MNGSIADQFKEIEREAFGNIGLAYYEGVRNLRGLRIWLVCHREVRSVRWVRLNSSQAEAWLQHGVAGRGVGRQGAGAGPVPGHHCR